MSCGSPPPPPPQATTTSNITMMPLLRRHAAITTIILSLSFLASLPLPIPLTVFWTTVDAFSSPQTVTAAATSRHTTPITSRIVVATTTTTIATTRWQSLSRIGRADDICCCCTSSSLFMSAGDVALPRLNDGEEGEDEEMEWVEEEFELLTERDFFNTEWKIGTLMDDKPRDAKSIDTTWVRLVTTDSGENEAIWGDGAKGKWTIDVPSQFFSISKESFGGWMGKKIWAGTIEDFYYLEGTVRGWGPLSPASVVGQWQGVRLGIVDGERVTAEERGVAPWFAVDDKDEDKSNDAADADDGDAGDDES